MRQHETNMQFLETVHAIHTSATKAIEAIDKKLGENLGEAHVTVRTEALEMLKLVIEVQDRAIRKMAEADQETTDALEQIVTKFRK